MRQLTFSFLFVGLMAWAAFGSSGCGVPCDNDYDCPRNSICEPREGGGRYCTDAQECVTAADCPTAQHYCAQRADAPPQNPFDSPVPGKTVCLCTTDHCSPPTVVSSSTSSSSSSSATGAGGSGGNGGSGGTTGSGGSSVGGGH